MKRTQIIFYVLVVLLSLLSCLKLFNSKFYTSHDGEGHIIRMEEFHQALSDGQFPVRLAKRINYGLGYPFFNFNYPLVYYLGESFFLLGLSFLASYKLIFIFSSIIGAISFYLFLTRHFSSLASLAGTIYFIFAPYKFLNMYVRGDVAESLGLALLAFCFLSAELVLEKKKFSGLAMISAFSVLILSHNITALIGSGLIFLYVFFKIAIKKANFSEVKKIGVYFIVSLALTSFFWFPAIFESRLTKIYELQEDYKKNFPSVSEIIYSPWGFGQWKEGIVPGKMSPQIGLSYILVLTASLAIFIYNYFYQKSFGIKEKSYLFFLILFFLFFWLSLSYSKILWDSLFILRYVQFPWRFAGQMIIPLSFCAGYFVEKIGSRKIKYASVFFLTIFALYANRNHIRVNMYLDYKSPFLNNQIYAPSTTSNDEHMPKDAPRIWQSPDTDGDIIPEKAGNSKRLIWQSNYHLFEVKVDQNALFRDNTSYFPGWQARIDGRETAMLYNEDLYKRLLINIPSGLHKVEFYFKETWYRLAADVISLVAFFIILASFVEIKFKKQ